MLGLDHVKKNPLEQDLEVLVDKLNMSRYCAPAAKVVAASLAALGKALPLEQVVHTNCGVSTSSWRYTETNWTRS